MAKPAIIPPIDATPEELAKMLLQPQKKNEAETSGQFRNSLPEGDDSSTATSTRTGAE